MTESDIPKVMKLADDYVYDGFTVTPLYTSPPAPSNALRMAKEALKLSDRIEGYRPDERGLIAAALAAINAEIGEKT